MQVVKWNVIALAVAAGSSQMVAAVPQTEAKGFVDEASLDLLLRNAYFSRDHKDGVKDQSRWGQGFIATFNSGFTQGAIGAGIDAYGLLGVKLDTGKNRNDDGIFFFAQRSNGKPLDDISEAGAALKLQISNTVLKYGNQMPSLPVLAHNTMRLLPQTFTGTLLTSKEIDGLELNFGRFTSQNGINRAGRDVGTVGHGVLKSINLAGGSYEFTESFSAALYFSDITDVAKKNYANLNYVMPLTQDQSLGFDFNIYKSDYDQKFTKTGHSEDNTIWSLAVTYTTGAHSFFLAHQRATGDWGYDYDVGDGGNAIYLTNLPNTLMSNFKDERAWQVSYELDFGSYGVPGLYWKTAYIRGSNIDASYYGGEGRATEREIFNQVSHVVQNGPAKGLSVRLRNSILRTNNPAWNGMNEFRVVVEYPLRIL